MLQVTNFVLTILLAEDRTRNNGPDFHPTHYDDAFDNYLNKGGDDPALIFEAFN